ncbi:MAG TPA: hypothetical protein VHA79_09260 [Mycobacteriales bacterium]|nr:hypothetical protein [Mycobacteriales bacterium]
MQREAKFCDVAATRGDERLYAEAKGRTTDAGLDVDTLYGQLLRRIPADGLKYDLGVVVPTNAVGAALRVDRHVRAQLGITVFEVTDEGQVRTVSE